jgi:hypothetical protein
MKKVNLLLAASVVALGSVFTSCSDSENAVPTITFAATAGTMSADGETLTLASGTTASFSYTVSAEAEIKTLKVGLGTARATVDKAAGEVTYNGTASAEVGQTYTIEVEDKDGNSLSKTLTIKTSVVTTPLAAATEFTLIQSSINQNDGKNANTTVGIKYTENTAGTAPIKFEANFTGAKTFVMLTKAEFDAIATKEALKKAYDDKAASAVASFKAVAEPTTSFVAQYLAVKTGDTYFLVELKSVTLVEGANKAVFSYKK